MHRSFPCDGLLQARVQTGETTDLMAASDLDPLVLASRSPARAAMLRAAGIAIDLVPARIDEPAITASMYAEGARPRDIADMLAEMKARRVAQRLPGRLVLGADQVLVMEDDMFVKPRSLTEARAQLDRLRGRTHELLSAAVVFEAGAPVWRQIGRARLTMRSFSDAFLDDYLAAEGDALLQTVGCYRLEGRGAQLFIRVEGDYFSILGLPLLEVLSFLRTRGLCGA